MTCTIKILSGNNNPDDEAFIPELYADPASPDPEEVWVLMTTLGGQISHSLAPLGMLLTSTAAVITYQLSYRTLEGTTVRVTLS